MCPHGPYKQRATLPRRKCQESHTAPWHETSLAQAHFHKMETPSPKWIGYSDVSHNSPQETNFYIKLLKPTLGYGFHFQQRNPRTLPIERFAHDSGCTLVHAKYGYSKGSPITNPPLQLSIQCLPQCTPRWPSSEPHGATIQQVVAKTPVKWSAYQIPSVV
jgi:hypothetical protein